jgi:hypothetical protein
MRTVSILVALAVAAAAQPSFGQSPAGAAEEFYPPQAKALLQIVRLRRKALQEWALAKLP